MSFGARSGARLPSLRYGKSMRAVGSGATAASMARSAGWFRSLPAPGARTSAPTLTCVSSDEDAAGFGQLCDSLRGNCGVGAMVGMGVSQEPAEPALDLLPRGGAVGGKAEQIEGPQGGIEIGGRRPGRGAVAAGEVGDERRSDLAAPTQPLPQHVERAWTNRRRQLTGCVRRREGHLQRRAVAFVVVLELLTTAEEPADGTTEAVLVGLETVADTRLHDALPVFELCHQDE